MIKVLLASDRPEYRTRIRTILEQNGDFEIVGTAETGRQAIEMERALAPNVLLLDMELPDVQGNAVTSSIVGSKSAVRILPLSGHSEMANALAALDAGAHGYASKDEPIDSLVHALRLVASGNMYLSPTISLSILNWRSQHGTTAAAPGEACEILFGLGVTPRLLEILQSVSDGQRDEAIATALNLSPFTVRNHVARLRELLDLPTRVALAAWCWRSGFKNVSSEYYALWYTMRCSR